MSTMNGTIYDFISSSIDTGTLRALQCTYIRMSCKVQDPRATPPTSEATMTASPFLTLHELVKKARQKLNHDNWDYIVGGTETETTVRRNRLALDSIAFRPRVLRDVSQVDASTRFLGHPLRLPVVLAPVGGLEHFAAGAGGAAVKAAEEFGIAHMLS